MGKVTAVCISEKRGTKKKEVQSAFLRQNWGIENDAHAGDWHRQVSLLPIEKSKRSARKEQMWISGILGKI